ncbi:MAG: exodeoxyribonuclease VII large subunit [Bdellovibrionales bacterium]|nr:exodeoxyribonuclease VII large subunit [Bdellovibrionales bacterium]
MKQVGFDFSEKAQDDPVDSEAPKVFSVSDLNSGVRRILEANYPLIWVQGEISNFTAHGSGHFYFSLKDKKSQISAVMFKGYNSRLKFKPETGMEVLVRGKITVYEPRGNYQLFCELMEPVGLGAMQKQFEQLKAKLKKEGLFEANRKKSLPPFPKHIAVVTSKTGAAIRDILNVLKRRNKTAHITVIPALVQGAGTAASVIEAIHLAERLSDVDVMIVGRGGGSMEDLWGFNDEALARTIANCPIPIVSAVGHEIDFTIADFVADLRAPTPSAAAELVVKNVDDLVEKSQLLHRRLVQAISVLWKQKRERLKFLTGRLVDPKRQIEQRMQRCDELVGRLQKSIFRLMEKERQNLRQYKYRMGDPRQRVKILREQWLQLQRRLSKGVSSLLERHRRQWQQSVALLDSLSPLKVVDRGYAIVKLKNKVVKSVKDLKSGDPLDIQVAQGFIQAQVESIRETAKESK